jgi:hypothetical protein
MSRRFPMASDLLLNGREIVGGKFEELEDFPSNPFKGQMVLISNAIIGSKVFCYNGAQWICGVTSLNGSQGDIQIDKSTIGLNNVDNVKQQPWSEILTDIAEGVTEQTSNPVSTSDETLRSISPKMNTLTGVNPYFLLYDPVSAKWKVVNNFSIASIVGGMDLSGAASAVHNDILQMKEARFVNRSLSQYKTDLALDSVNNTSDVDKPVSTATAAAITTASTIDRARANHTGTQLSSTISDLSTAVDNRIALQKGVVNGLATLDVTGKLSSAQIPAITITSTSVVNTQAAQLALTAQEGDVAIRSDLPATFIKNSGNTGTMSDWTQIATPTDLVLSVNGMTGVVTITKSHVGLSNVDNTSDINKPVSTATAAAIAAAIAARRYSVNLPAMANNGSAVITHNLGTTDIICGFQDATTKEAARLNWRANTINAVTVFTDVAIAANAVRIVIQA